LDRDNFRERLPIVDLLRKKAPQWCPYFDVEVVLAWSYDTKCYAGGIVATGRASHARHVKGDDPKKRISLVL
jgi:hypothetical protein